MNNDILKFKNPESWIPGREHFKAVFNASFTHDKTTSVDYCLLTDGDTLLCVFQGSVQNKDWEADFEFTPEKLDVYPGSDIMAHKGIAKQYLGMRNEFMDLAYRDDIRNILIAGYSLGGGLSQLACEDAAWHFSKKLVKSISYEGPRVFYHNDGVRDLLKERQILIKTFCDPVVHLPLQIMGLCDYGVEEWIGKVDRIQPLQHLPDQVEKNLYEKYGR